MVTSLLAAASQEKGRARALAIFAAAVHVISKLFGSPIAGPIFCVCVLAASLTALDSFPDKPSRASLQPATSTSPASWLVWCARLAMLGPALEASQLAQRSPTFEVLVAFNVHALNFVVGMLAIQLVSCRCLLPWQALRGYFVFIGVATFVATALVVGLGGSEYPAPGGTSHSVVVPLGCAMVTWLFASLTAPASRKWSRTLGLDLHERLRLRRLAIAPRALDRVQVAPPSPPPSPPPSTSALSTAEATSRARPPRWRGSLRKVRTLGSLVGEDRKLTTKAAPVPTPPPVPRQTVGAEAEQRDPLASSAVCSSVAPASTASTRSVRNTYLAADAPPPTRDELQKYVEVCDRLKKSSELMALSSTKHLLSAQHYFYLYCLMAIPSIVISSFVSVVNSLVPEAYAPTMGAIANATNTILLGISAVLRYESRAALHQNAAFKLQGLRMKQVELCDQLEQLVHGTQHEHSAELLETFFRTWSDRQDTLQAKAEEVMESAPIDSRFVAKAQAFHSSIYDTEQKIPMMTASVTDKESSTRSATTGNAAKSTFGVALPASPPSPPSSPPAGPIASPMREAPTLPRPPPPTKEATPSHSPPRQQKLVSNRVSSMKSLPLESSKVKASSAQELAAGQAAADEAASDQAAIVRVQALMRGKQQRAALAVFAPNAGRASAGRPRASLTRSLTRSNGKSSNGKSKTTPSESVTFKIEGGDIEDVKGRVDYNLLKIHELRCTLQLMLNQHLVASRYYMTRYLLLAFPSITVSSFLAVISIIIPPAAGCTADHGSEDRAHQSPFLICPSTATSALLNSMITIILGTMALLRHQTKADMHKSAATSLQRLLMQLDGIHNKITIYSKEIGNATIQSEARAFSKVYIRLLGQIYAKAEEVAETMPIYPTFQEQALKVHTKQLYEEAKVKGVLRTGSYLADLFAASAELKGNSFRHRRQRVAPE